MKIHDVTQGTEEWLKLRLGKFTASSAQAIANNGKGLETVVFEKVAEILTGKEKEAYTNGDIERGHQLEEMARSAYELEKGTPVKKVGFIEIDEYRGCSPDGLVGEDGLVEIKCKNDVNFVRMLIEPKIDPEHHWQMQMQLFLTGRSWCDYVVFNPNFPKSIIVVRVERDKDAIAKLNLGLNEGIATIRKILEKLND